MRHVDAAPSGPASAQLDALDRLLINHLQGGFPICERPYAAAADALGMHEEELIRRIQHLLDARVLTRFGPLYNADRLGGANVLAAMPVHDADFSRVAEFVNLQPEIAHNYRREHDLNMWFVGAAETPEKVEATFGYIEAVSGYHVYRFPKLREFFVELKLSV